MSKLISQAAGGRTCFAALVGVLTLAAACSTTPSDRSLASTLPHINVTHPVVIVPGILGSRLEDERNGRVVWGKMLEAFEVCGYRPGELQSCGLHANAAVFAYDWRRDIVENAQLLAASIRDIQANTGDPATKVDLVAHSMGGLIVEYFLLYGDEDVLDQGPLSGRLATTKRRALHQVPVVSENGSATGSAASRGARSVPRPASGTASLPDRKRARRD